MSEGGRERSYIGSNSRPVAQARYGQVQCAGLRWDATPCGRPTGFLVPSQMLAEDGNRERV